jgi:hypothetical protein
MTRTLADCPEACLTLGEAFQLIGPPADAEESTALSPNSAWS